MCELTRSPQRAISVAGEARRLNLYSWTVTDLKAGDRGLHQALIRWRDALITRLPKWRAMKIRIPWIFVSALGLKNQRVFLAEDNAVYVLEGEALGHHLLGRLLVPGRKC